MALLGGQRKPFLQRLNSIHGGFLKGSRSLFLVGDDRKRPEFLSNVLLSTCRKMLQLSTKHETGQIKPK
jgi:hypothetical protein